MYNEVFAEAGLSLGRLRTLVEVAETNSISLAVDRDPTRQSQYSRQLKELETYFGTPLTRRVGKGLELTPAGKELSVLSRQFLTALSDYKRRCLDQMIEYRIGAGESLLIWKVIPTISKVKQNFRKTSFSLFNLRSNSIADRLNDLSLDFGVLRQEAILKPLESRPLGRTRFVLIAPREMVPPKRRKEPKWILQNCPVATLGEPGSFARNMEQSAVKEGMTVNVQLQCQSFPEAEKALVSRTFCAILPDVVVAEYEKKYLIYELPFFDSIAQPVVLAWNPRIINTRTGAAEVLAMLYDGLKF